MSYELSAADLTLLHGILGGGELGRYDGTTFTPATGRAAAVAEIMSNPNWRDLPLPAPETVRPVQFRLALIMASRPVDELNPGGASVIPWAQGLDLPALIDAYLVGQPMLQAQLEYGLTIYKADLLEPASEMGFTPAQLDDILRLAATL